MKRPSSLGAAWLGWLIMVSLMLLAFAYFPGLDMISPENTQFVLKKGDWATHYLGWAFFRYAEWGYPWGAIPDYYYPNGTNIGYTDSIPLMAMLLRPFDAWLPDHFQYLGLWLIGCWGLQLWTAWGLLGTSPARALALRVPATLLLSFAPVLYLRSPHPALCAHFLILGSLWLYRLPVEAPLRQRIALLVGLSFMGAWIHPYWAVMSLPLAVACLYRWVFFTQEIKAWWGGLVLLLLVGLTVGIWQGLGYFSLSRESQVSGGLGDFSSNLNTYFNAMEFGWLLPPLPAFTRQYEGFAYLGAGLLGLLASWLLCRIWVRPSPDDSLRIWPLWVAGVALAVLALSPKITLGTWVLFDGLPWFDGKHPLHVFRSTGRFIWVSWYLIACALLIAWTRLPFRQGILGLGLWVAVAIQWVDMLPANQVSQAPVPSAETYLTVPQWQPLMAQALRIETYPPLRLALGADGQGPILAELAAIAHKPITMGYVARQGKGEYWQFHQEARKVLETGALQPDVLYVVQLDEALDIERALSHPQVEVQLLDGLLVLIHRDSKAALQERLEALRGQGQEGRLSVKALRSFLARHANHWTVALTDDEATARLAAADRDYLRSRGGEQIERLAFRGAYWALLAQDQVIADSLSAQEASTYTISAGDSVGQSRWPFDMSLRVRGGSQGQRGYLEIPGQPLHSFRRGFNLFAFDSVGTILDSAHFDTYAESHQIEWMTDTTKLQ
jgi:hypothetical protein